jgi:hypothetical protein
MNPNTDPNSRNLTTADLARAGAPAQAPGARGQQAERNAERTPGAPAAARSDARSDGLSYDRSDTEADARSTARAAARPEARAETRGDPRSEKLEALFTPETTTDFRSQWIDIQARFVDDPRQAVRDGDELVAKVMKSLAESFAHEKERVDGQLQDGGDASTELLRVALRRYRSFFERLLTL